MEVDRPFAAQLELERITNKSTKRKRNDSGKDSEDTMLSGASKKQKTANKVAEVDSVPIILGTPAREVEAVSEESVVITTRVKDAVIAKGRKQKAKMTNPMIEK